MELQPYHKRYNEIRTLFDNKRSQESVDEAKKTLTDENLPKYFRMKLLVLIACTVNDVHEIEMHWKEAEKMWQRIRQLYASGVDAGVENMLAELRHSLDHLRKHLEWVKTKGTVQEQDQCLEGMSDTERAVDSGDVFEDALEVLEETDENPRPAGLHSSFITNAGYRYQPSSQTTSAQGIVHAVNWEGECQRMKAENDELKRHMAIMETELHAGISDLEHEILYTRTALRNENKAIRDLMLKGR